MTRPLIELPSVIQSHLRDENKTLATENKSLLAALADRDTILADKDAMLADKDAELARLRELLKQNHIPLTT